MKKTKIFSLLLAFSLLITPLPSRAATINQKLAAAATAVGVSCVALYGLYKWYFAEISNTELCEQGKRLYEALHGKHTSIALLYRSLSTEMNEVQLYELVNHKDLPRLKDVSKDLPQLNSMIMLFSARLKKESNEGNLTDFALEKQCNELKSLRDALKRVADFWKTHACFYELHYTVSDVSSQYSSVRSGLVSELFDYYAKRGEKAFDKLAPQLEQDVRILSDKAASCESYSVLFSNTQSLIGELELIQESAAALKAFLALEKEFQRYDGFAKKLSFRDFQELPAKVKGVYAGKQDHPFEYVAREANKALSALESDRNAVIASPSLFNQEDPFSQRVYDLLGRVEELSLFLTTLREQVVSLPEYDYDMRVRRKDKQYAKEVALEQERIRKEDERKKEELRLEKEWAERSERIEQEKIDALREKAVREQMAKKYEADKKLEQGRLLNEVTQKEKEIQELKMQQEKKRTTTANGSSAT